MAASKDAIKKRKQELAELDEALTPDPIGYKDPRYFAFHEAVVRGLGRPAPLRPAPGDLHGCGDLPEHHSAKLDRDRAVTHTVSQRLR